MPRRMGELRRLNLEWNGLVETARQHGIRRVELPDFGRTVRVRPRAHFQMARIEARARVAALRNSVARFYGPSVSTAFVAGLEDSFGVEIEAVLRCTSHALAQAVRDTGTLCQVESYNHITRNHWKLTTDQSISGSSGREMVSPPLMGEAGFEALRKVTGVMTEMGCDANHISCGLHVHVGMGRHIGRLQTFKNLVLMAIKWDKAIDGFMAPSRRTGGSSSNNWCMPVRITNQSMFDSATTLNDLVDSVGQPHRADVRSSYRYRKMNLMAMRQSGTVEFRQHQGTNETRKIEMWVRLVLRMVNAASRAEQVAVEVQPNTLDGLLSFVECDADEKAYFTERTAYFAAQEQRRRERQTRRLGNETSRQGL